MEQLKWFNPILGDRFWKNTNQLKTKHVHMNSKDLVKNIWIKLLPQLWYKLIETRRWKPFNCYRYGIADNILTSGMIIWNSIKIHLIIPILYTTVHIHIFGVWLNLLNTRIDREWGILSQIASSTDRCIDSSITLHWSIKRISSMHCWSSFLS